MTKRIISIDVGIKNLAYCILERTDNNFKIFEWDIINILDDKLNNVPKCCNFSRNKICNKPACFTVKHKNIDDSFSELSYCNKKTCEKFMKDTYKNEKIIKLKKITAKNTGILELTSILLNKLEKIKDIILTVDEVVIENQPVLKNPTMKSIQMVLYTYFVEHGYNITSSKIQNVYLFSARNKLKLYDGPKIECNKKSNYEKRKFLSVEYTKYYIKDNNKLLDFFLNNKKKDDLADSFIQGYYYLFK